MAPRLSCMHLWRPAAVAALLMPLLIVAAPAAASPPQIILSRAAYAAFEVEDGLYSIDIGARQETVGGVTATSAQARGEVDLPGEELYYFAFGGRDAQLDVNGTLTSASLHATIPVLYCFNVEGDQVTDNRCPVGSVIEVTAQFSSDQPLLTLNDRDENGVNITRGRLGSASGTQNGESPGPSIYAEIVENRTVYHGG